MDLTAEQKAFAEHSDEAFVEACPGAGKTRTILARLAYLAKSLPPRRGIVILSFTNKAIEEFKSRSGPAGVSQLLQFPGFIGTFDAFVRHFLFAPGGVQGNASKPHVVDSWDSLGVEIRLRGARTFAGPGVSLDLFDPRTNQIEPTRITHGGLRKHVSDHRSEYEVAARQRREGLNRTGYFSAHDTRVVTSDRIRDANWGSALGRAIAGRFEEIIVDEAQDCNPSDLEVLTWLRSHGVRVTLVCDMDQSIYAFRDGERQHLERFASTYASANRLSLTGNFRSAPAICSLSASLRSRSAPDDSIGATASLDHPILLYSYGTRTVSPQIGNWFASIATSDRFGIMRDNLIILGHSERSACLASGNLSSPLQGQSKVERLARAINEFWTGTTQSDKAAALACIEQLMLEITGQRAAGEPLSRAIERNGIDRRILRRQALVLTMSMPRMCADTDADGSAWVDAARDLIQKVGFNPPNGQTIRKAIARPPGNDWLRHLGGNDAHARLHYATIHNAKGGEYDGVCVVLPPDDTRGLTAALFAAWASRSEYEAKRVIYVGVTRAMRLVALAVPTSFIDNCVAILTAASVPHEIHREAPSMTSRVSTHTS